MLKTIVALFVMAVPTLAQTPVLPTPDPAKLPPQRVTVFKDLEDSNKLPVSVDAVPQTVLDSIGARIVSDAAIYAPNSYFSEFTARKLSTPRFRGIGSSPLNPGVTTYFDGVPQFNANSSSIELLDIDQVEFARGPVSALSGRNTLGGVINVTSRRPSLSSWQTSLVTSAGSFAEFRGVLSISGPVAPNTAASLTFGGAGRKGFTINDTTGRDIDSRAGSFLKGQYWWAPSSRWESRIIVNSQIDRDGDYALGDLAFLITHPYHVSRDYEGDTRRNVFSTTVLGRYEDPLFTFSTITGFGHWSTRDRTDLDYTSTPLIRRTNSESDFQFTEEIRFAINTPAPITSNINLMWQTGLFVFAQNYSQDAFNDFESFALSPSIAVPVRQTSPNAQLDDTGVAVYGQATVTFMKKFDLLIGLRAEREDKHGTLVSSYSPAVAPPTTVDKQRNFRKWSPEFAGTYHLSADRIVYMSFGHGFKSGGFNPASPVGKESYNPENAYHVEAGVKNQLADGKVMLVGAVYFIDWNQLQLNQPNPSVPQQFFIANVDGARSKGAEAELHARPHPDLDLFAGAGLTQALFDPGTISNGVDVSRNEVPNAPRHTFTVGTELKHKISDGLTLYGHFDTLFSGSFKYDDLNNAGQPPYSLINFRAGARNKKLSVEFWMKNAAGTTYIPIAFPFTTALAPSGFLGEMGPPRRYGVSAQVHID